MDADPQVHDLIANPFIPLCWLAVLFAAVAWLRVWRRLSALSDRGYQTASVWTLVEPAALFTSGAMFLGLIAWVWQGAA
ncbi:hypothetical protein FHS54_001457 [Sphingobium vermicomposti]|uniref:Uncharacterized protein n=1 Tax=Sphingobium vermicomposti TaxID=529005 RepID=A0A846M756_9SPHN|nr:hypothetical protein [Sphingobium vermicomposti]